VSVVAKISGPAHAGRKGFWARLFKLSSRDYIINSLCHTHILL